LESFTHRTAEDPVVVQVKTPDKARALVREQIARKVDIVKIGLINAPAYRLRRFIPILDAVIDGMKKCIGRT
jgi:hypothetical protein